MATFQMPSYFLESRNKYIRGRIKRNLQNQEICYLYSQEGTRFQISKVCIPRNCIRIIIQFLIEFIFFKYSSVNLQKFLLTYLLDCLYANWKITRYSFVNIMLQRKVYRKFQSSRILFSGYIGSSTRNSHKIFLHR